MPDPKKANLLDGSTASSPDADCPASNPGPRQGLAPPALLVWGACSKRCLPENYSNAIRLRNGLFLITAVLIGFSREALTPSSFRTLSESPGAEQAAVKIAIAIYCLTTIGQFFSLAEITEKRLQWYDHPEGEVKDLSSRQKLQFMALSLAGLAGTIMATSTTDCTRTIGMLVAPVAANTVAGLYNMRCPDRQQATLPLQNGSDDDQAAPQDSSDDDQSAPQGPNNLRPAFASEK